MNSKNVLLIENSMVDAILIKDALQQNGKPCNINLFEDGPEAITYIENILQKNKNEIPDLIRSWLNTMELTFFPKLEI